jgi:hypothetical protein
MRARVQPADLNGIQYVVGRRRLAKDSIFATAGWDDPYHQKH